MKYLGFNLKPSAYSINDWTWITDKFYKLISGWEYRCLSMAGRLILTQSVLTQLSVYWAQLYHLPSAILNRLNRLMACFIWGGNKEKRKFHLSNLKYLTLPKKTGGWGIMQLRIFGMALLCRSLWRAVFGDNLWSAVVKTKYLRNKDIQYWYRTKSFGKNQGSVIWSSLTKVSQYFFKRMLWKFQSGNHILIGIDPISGVQSDSPFLEKLLTAFHQKGIFFWAQVINGWQGSIPTWKTTNELGLEASPTDSWNKIIWDMKLAGLYRSEVNDSIIIQIKEGKSNVQVKDIYLSMIANHMDVSRCIFPVSFWKTGVPLKITLFAWLVFHDKNLTWNNLQKRNWQGPAICYICFAGTEDNHHMFLNCHIT